MLGVIYRNTLTWACSGCGQQVTGRGPAGRPVHVEHGHSRTAPAWPATRPVLAGNFAIAVGLVFHAGCCYSLISPASLSRSRIRPAGDGEGQHVRVVAWCAQTHALALVAAPGVVVRDVLGQDRALDAYSRFGKGRHPAALNFGDCCTYAIASVAGESLLCIGDDFARTDLLLVSLNPDQ